MHRLKPASVCLLAGLSLASCAGLAPESRQLDVEPPPRWSASPEEVEGGGAPLADRWWQAFEDPALTAAVEEALEHNRDLVAAEARLRQAEARARIAGATLSPQVGAGFNGSRSKRNFIGFPIPGQEGGEVLSTTTTTLGVSLDVSWEPDLWGGIRAGREAAKLDAVGAASQVEGARLSLSAQVVKAWLATVEAKEQVELAELALETRESSTARIRRRYEAGLRPALDLRLALADQAGSEAQLALRRQLLDAARRQLEVLLGRYPEGRLEPADLPAPPPAPDAGLPAELVARRPDLAAAEQRLEAAGLRVTEARAALYPRLSLSASGGTASSELEDLLDSDFSVWSLAAGLLQPIFQGGRLRANVDLAEATAEEAFASYGQAVLGAFREVESALAAEDLLVSQRKALEEAVEQAEAAERLADHRYRTGLGDVLEILESQRSAVDARSRLLEQRRLQLENRVDLYLALGGGFQATSGTMTEPEASAEGGTEPARAH